jgi:hypothetical protein
MMMMQQEKIPNWVAEFLNRRAKIEQELFDCAVGKAPLPDKEKCKEWALRLGKPENM